VKLENAFEVAAPPDEAWALLMDVPRIVPCMPGAELVETLGEDAWKARMKARLGPMSMVFDTMVKREDVDEAARRVTLSADAREARGRGQARASIQSSVTESEGGARIEITTDVALSGPVAQFGRGIVQEVAGELVNSFAQCIGAQLASAPAAAAAEGPGDAARPAPTPVPPAKPVSGLSLGMRALVRAIAGFIRRRVRRT
jgi:carbon monoxide dehydrogenase subunit G